MSKPRKLTKEMDNPSVFNSSGSFDNDHEFYIKGLDIMIMQNQLILSNIVKKGKMGNFSGYTRHA
jgi:hypothetical protein